MKNTQKLIYISKWVYYPAPVPTDLPTFCCEWVVMNGFSLDAPATMPGDDLLFQCLSNSTIGAVWFHVRVRDGIGWVTDAMVTKQ